MSRAKPDPIKKSLNESEALERIFVRMIIKDFNPQNNPKQNLNRKFAPVRRSLERVIEEIALRARHPKQNLKLKSILPIFNLEALPRARYRSA